jgi:subtilase-type serine protease
MQRPLTRAGLALACLAPALSACGPTAAPIPEESGYFDVFYDVYFVESFAPYAEAASNLVTNDARYLFEKSFGWFFSDAPTVTYNSYPLESSRVQFAHAAGLTGQGQIIGFLDSGFDPTHPDFASKTIYSAENLATLPVDAHGTMVVGVAAADGTGSMIGIAPNADILLGSFDSQAQMADAINLARSIGAVAINNSWGYTNLNATQPGYDSAFGGNGGATYLQALRSYAAEGVVVFALRNDENLTRAGIMDGLPVLEPQLESGWIAVGNAVPEYDDTSIQSVERISSACLESARWCLFADGAWESTTAGGGYEFSTGASFAAPQVSGALALLAEAFSGMGLTPHQLRDRLLASADNSFLDSFDGILDFGNGVTHGFNEEFGHGFLDIRAALLPIGGAAVPTPSGASIPVGEPAVVTGSAFGDAVTEALEGRQVVVEDALAATFTMPAAALSASARPVPLSVMRAAEISGANLAPLREGAVGDGSAGLLGAYGGKMVPTTIETIEANVLMPSLGGSAGISLRQTSEFGSAEINWGFSWLSDQGGPLSIGGPKGPGASNVASLDLGIGGEVAPGAYVSVNAQAGIVTPPAQALFNEISHITFDSLSATLQLASVGRENDLLSFSVAAPPSVKSGTAQTTLPMALSEGGISYEDMTLNLAPQSRQIDLGVTYQSPLSENTELFLGAYGSENMAGGRAPNFGAVLAVQFSF